MRERRRARTLAAVVLAGTALAGCGGGDDYANDPRPPAPINVSASIGTEKVSISPGRFGAGPVKLIIVNQTKAAQQLTLQTDGRGPGIKQETGPINPSETAELKVELREGTYDVGVSGDGIDDARLVVGPQRPSAQNDLLQP